VIGNDSYYRDRAEAIDVGTIFWLARNIKPGLLQSRRRIKHSKISPGLVLLKGVTFLVLFRHCAV
jgi:hypothetical protein